MFRGYIVYFSNGRGDKASSEAFCFAGGLAVSVTGGRDLKSSVNVVGRETSSKIESAILWNCLL